MCWSGAPRKHSPLPLSDRPLALPARPLTTVDDRVTPLQSSNRGPPLAGIASGRGRAGGGRRDGSNKVEAHHSFEALLPAAPRTTTVHLFPADKPSSPL